MRSVALLIEAVRVRVIPEWFTREKKWRKSSPEKKDDSPSSKKRKWGAR